MKTKTIITIIAIILVIALIIGLCYGYYQKFGKEVQNPIATMVVEGYGEVKIELYPEFAPNTVANFIRLANRGFYDNLTFHRTIPDFMIQGGDKSGNGSGSPSLSDIKDEVAVNEEYSIKGEFIANGFNKNTLRHTEGVISMARSDYSAYGYTQEGYNSAGSQFFIMTKDTSSLNGLYAAFGKVKEGIAIIHNIENVEVVTRETNAEGADKPVNPPVIKSIRVETFGVDYGIPETVQPFNLSKLFN